MKQFSIVIAGLAMAAFLCAQDKPPAAADAAGARQENLEAAVIPVKTLTGDSFDRLTRLLGAFNVRFAADEKLRTIVVYAPKDVIEKMRKVVEQLDQPGSEAAIGRNIDMTLAFLRCSTKAPAQPSPPLPADLEPVARQLRAATQCKDVELWDTLPLRLQEGKDTTESLLLPNTSTSADLKGHQTIGQLKIRPEGVTRKDQGRYVRFSSFQVNFRIPYAISTGYNLMDVGLTTSGDFMEGQRTVLGKISGTDDETSIFVVISLKVLD